jgi:hypothetical protein
MNCWTASAVLGSVNPKAQARSPLAAVCITIKSSTSALFFMAGLWVVLAGTDAKAGKPSDE